MKILERISPRDLRNFDGAVASLSKCLDKLRSHDFTDVLKLMAEGLLTLWTWGDGFILLEIVKHPRAKELVVFAVWGKNYLRNHKLIMIDLEDIAREHGCDYITAYVERKGWFRPFLGFNKTYRFIKEIVT